jgi:hypothetical protein
MPSSVHLPAVKTIILDAGSCQETRTRDIADVPTRIQVGAADARVSGSFSINERSRATGVPVLASVDVQGTGFYDGAPMLDVRRVRIYESGSSTAAVEVRCPAMTGLQKTFETKRQTYSFAIPAQGGRPPLKSGKAYTIVAEVGINGAEPQEVRSPYLPVAAL